MFILSDGAREVNADAIEGAMLIPAAVKAVFLIKVLLVAI
jgi:hypothetical protein